MTDHLRIVSLDAENVKRLRAVHIEPNPTDGLVIIGGDNAQGKTSVLDSIMWALGGLGTVSEMPIREGERQASIRVDLGDMTVTRTFTPKGSRLEVTGADGSKFASPQSLLDSLTGAISFDPLEFARMDARKQVETLMRAVGLDFKDLNAARKASYDERTVINRQLATATAQLQAMPRHADAPATRPDLYALRAEVERRASVNKDFAQHREALEKLKASRESALESAARLDAEKVGIADALTAALVKIDQWESGEIERIRRQASENREAARADSENMAAAKSGAANKYREAATAYEAEIADAERILSDAVDLDEAEAVAALNKAEADLERVIENEAHAKARENVIALQKRSDAETAAIEKIDQDKADMISKATMPVDGLSFSDDSVLLNGIPLSQSSSAQVLRVSTGIGLALNPKLRVILIRDGSLLDNANLEAMRQAAGAANAQIWVERVGDDGRATVIIEDGMVKE